MSTEPVIPALLVTEPQDAALAEQLSIRLAKVGIVVSPPELRELSVRYRLDLEHRLREANLVIAVWTKHSTTAPWTLDQADVAARAGSLLNLEAGAQAPLGYNSLTVAKLKIHGNEAVGSQFRFREDIFSALERMKLRKPRRVNEFRPLSFMLDSLSQFAIAMAYDASRGGSNADLAFNASIFFAFGYLAGRLFDLVARMLGVSMRNYVGRLLARALGQTSAQVILVFAFVHATFQSQLFLGADVAAGVFLRTLPYLLIITLRRRLLA